MFVVDLVVGLFLGTVVPAVLIYRREVPLRMAVFGTAVLAIIIAALPVDIGTRVGILIGLVMGFVVGIAPTGRLAVTLASTDEECASAVTVQESESSETSTPADLTTT